MRGKLGLAIVLLTSVARSAPTPPKDPAVLDALRAAFGSDIWQCDAGYTCTLDLVAVHCDATGCAGNDRANRGRRLEAKGDSALALRTELNGDLASPPAAQPDVADVADLECRREYDQGAFCSLVATEGDLELARAVHGFLEGTLHIGRPESVVICSTRGCELATGARYETLTGEEAGKLSRTLGRRLGERCPARGMCVVAADVACDARVHDGDLVTTIACTVSKDLQGADLATWLPSDHIDDEPLTIDLRAAFGSEISRCTGDTCATSVQEVQCDPAKRTCHALDLGANRKPLSATGAPAVRLARRLAIYNRVQFEHEVAAAWRIECTAGGDVTSHTIKHGSCMVRLKPSDDVLFGMLQNFIQSRGAEKSGSGRVRLACSSTGCVASCAPVSEQDDFMAQRCFVPDHTHLTTAALSASVRSRLGGDTATIDCRDREQDGGVTHVLACDVVR